MYAQNEQDGWQQPFPDFHPFDTDDFGSPPNSTAATPAYGNTVQSPLSPISNLFRAPPWNPAVSAASPFAEAGQSFGSYRSHAASSIAESVAPARENAGGTRTQSVWSGDDATSYPQSDTGLETSMEALHAQGRPTKRRQMSKKDQVPSTLRKSKKSAPTLHNERPFPCDVEGCAVTCRIQSELKKHKLTHDRPFKCRALGCKHAATGFTTKNDLERHEWGKHDIGSGNAGKWKCASPQCEGKLKFWKRVDNFRQHITRTHGEEGIDDLIQRSAVPCGGSEPFPFSSMPPIIVNTNMLGYPSINNTYRALDSRHAISGNAGVWKCASPQCEEKGKVWRRFDNFRQHVSRSHRDVEVDDLIQKSFVPCGGSEPFPMSSVPPMTVNPNMLGYSSNNSTYQTQVPSQPMSSWPASPLLGVENFSSTSSFDSYYQNEPYFAFSSPSSQASSYEPFAWDLSSQSASTVHSASVLSPASSYTSQSIHSTSGNREAAGYKHENSITKKRTRGPEIPLSINQRLAVPTPSQTSRRLRTLSTPAAYMDQDLQAWSSAPPSVVAHSLPPDAYPDKPAQRNASMNMRRYIDEGDCSNQSASTQASSYRDPAGALFESQVVLPDKQKVNARKTGPRAQPIPGPEERPLSRNEMPPPARRNFPCPATSCTSSFTSNSALEKHKRRHERPYACTSDDCPSSKTFGSKNDWKRHEGKQHRLVEFWRCRKCIEGTTFTIADDFHVHLHFVHGIHGKRSAVIELRESLVDMNEGTYWCGFCCRIMTADDEERDPFDQRCSHIANHFHPEKRHISEWHLPNGVQTKGQVEALTGAGEESDEESDGGSTEDDGDGEDVMDEDGTMFHLSDEEGQVNDADGDVDDQLMTDSVIYSPNASFGNASFSQHRDMGKFGLPQPGDFKSAPAGSGTGSSKLDTVFNCCQCSSEHIWNPIVNSCAAAGLSHGCDHRFCEVCYKHTYARRPEEGHW